MLARRTRMRWLGRLVRLGRDVDLLAMGGVSASGIHLALHREASGAVALAACAALSWLAGRGRRAALGRMDRALREAQ